MNRLATLRIAAMGLLVSTGCASVHTEIVIPPSPRRYGPR